MPRPSKERREQNENHEISHHPAPEKSSTASESAILTVGKWETMRFEAIEASVRMADETANHQGHQ
jgi:hypothetical protein